jgi:hypothetical protein
MLKRTENFALNVGQERRCATLLPLRTPASLTILPLSPSSPLPLEGAVRVGAKMGEDGSASGGSRQQQNACYLTATPPAAGRLPPPLPAGPASVGPFCFSQHHRLENEPKLSVRLLGLVAKPGTSQEKANPASRSSTAASRRPQRHHSCRPVHLCFCHQHSSCH